MSTRFIFRSVRWLCLSITLWAVTPLAQAKTPAAGLKRLPLEISADRRSATVQVPPGYGRVTLQRFQRAGGWRKVAVKENARGVVKFKLPAAGDKVRWRAIGRFKTGKAPRGKFPARFYQGSNRFAPKTATSTGGRLWKNLLSPAAIDDSAAGVGDIERGQLPEEADIWKIDGTTVYFFNQLRGLQVLDLANPADPRLTASLRMPAVGEDLYLLPGGGNEKHLLLLTAADSGTGGTVTRILLVKVAGGTAEVTHYQDVAGYLADSRLIGSRLVLATTEWQDDAVGGTVTHLTQWRVAAGEAPKAAGSTHIEGANPVIAAGPDWLALAVQPQNRWDVSDVSVFWLGGGALQRMAPPIRTAGMVPGKFAIQWRDNILTTISEAYPNPDDWSPVTILENFRAWRPDVIHPAVVEGRLGRLELGRGENLFATRLAGDKAYVVTFLQTDPFWVVDLGDPRAPKVAGHLEVPGWSSYLEPLGDFLLSIGWESDTVAASLFDVADPASPRLLRRLNLGEAGTTYSEALWDEKALKVLPDAGLAMVPLSSYAEDSATGEWRTKSSIQLLDIDLAGRDLRARGAIAHSFDARRAAVVDEALVSISQRVMVAAGIVDRDSPAVLSEVSLAWPVDRVLNAGNFLIQIEAGAAWSNGRATARISPARATEQILAEIDLGAGQVRDADFRDGRLFVLRDFSSPWLGARISPLTGESADRIVLDVYDGSALPALTKLGSRALAMKAGSQLAGDELLWPQPHRPAVVLRDASYWWGGPIMWDMPIMATSDLATTAKPAAKLSMMPLWQPQQARPRVVVFDVGNPQSPTAEPAVRIGTDETLPNGVFAARDGLLVIGADDYKSEATGLRLTAGAAQPSLHVVEVPESGTPIVRPGIDLPGDLFAVTELDRDGFLAYSRTEDALGSSLLLVSACDGYDAYQIDAIVAAPYAVVTAAWRRVFVADANGVQPYQLTAAGQLEAKPRLTLGWQPYALRVTKGALLATDWQRFHAHDLRSGISQNLMVPGWAVRLEHATRTADGDLLLSLGDFGAQRLNLR